MYRQIEEVEPTVGLPTPLTFLVGFFNVPVQAPTWATPFIRLFRETSYCKEIRLVLRCLSYAYVRSLLFGLTEYSKFENLSFCLLKILKNQYKFRNEVYFDN